MTTNSDNNSDDYDDVNALLTPKKFKTITKCCNAKVLLTPKKFEEVKCASPPR
jgi:hypothetical protein